MSADGIATHGQDVVRIWRKDHARNRACRVCGGDTHRAAMVHLAYTFEACNCPSAPYTHLVETLWHRRCFVAHESGSLSAQQETP